MEDKFSSFEELPSEIRRDILLRDSINRSRLLNTIHKDLLIEDFINNPKLITGDEVIEYADKLFLHLYKYLSLKIHFV